MSQTLTTHGSGAINSGGHKIQILSTGEGAKITPLPGSQVRNFDVQFCMDTPYPGYTVAHQIIGSIRTNLAVVTRVKLQSGSKNTYTSPDLEEDVEINESILPTVTYDSQGISLIVSVKFKSGNDPSITFESVGLVWKNR